MFTRSIQFRDDVNDDLVSAAEARRISVNWLVNQLCREGLDHLRPNLTVVDFADIEVAE
jgi:hypothetical protein